MRYSVLVTVLFCLGCFTLKAQGNMENEAGGDLLISLRNINFVKNNEYSNLIIEGYTLLGYFLQPEIVYRPDDKVSLSLGANMLSYSGTDKFSKIKPVFSTTFNFSEHSFFRMGTLSGSDEHRLFDQHFNKERIYTDYAEDGFQLRTEGNRFFSDTWLTWENFIFKDDNEREVLTAGESFSYSPPLIAEHIKVEIPVQILVKHYGGQISNYDEHVETYLNLATGIRASAGLNTQSKISAGIEGLFFYGSSVTKNSPWGFNKGSAGWYKLFMELPHVEIDGGYWHSNNFYAPEGNFIFGSVSDHIEGIVLSRREILTSSVKINLPWKDFLSFYFCFDGYYDARMRRFDNAMTLHLKFDRLIKLATIGKKQY